MGQLPLAEFFTECPIWGGVRRSLGNLHKPYVSALLLGSIASDTCFASLVSSVQWCITAWVHLRVPAPANPTHEWELHSMKGCQAKLIQPTAVTQIPH